MERWTWICSDAYTAPTPTTARRSFELQPRLPVTWKSRRQRRRTRWQRPESSVDPRQRLPRWRSLIYSYFTKIPLKPRIFSPFDHLFPLRQYLCLSWYLLLHVNNGPSSSFCRYRLSTDRTAGVSVSSSITYSIRHHIR
jgi:hypothetical protein